MPMTQEIKIAALCNLSEELARRNEELTAVKSASVPTYQPVELAKCAAAAEALIHNGRIDDKSRDEVINVLQNDPSQTVDLVKSMAYQRIGSEIKQASDIGTLVPARNAGTTKRAPFTPVEIPTIGYEDYPG